MQYVWICDGKTQKSDCLAKRLGITSSTLNFKWHYRTHFHSNHFDFVDKSICQINIIDKSQQSWHTPCGNNYFKQFDFSIRVESSRVKILSYRRHNFQPTVTWFRVRRRQMWISSVSTEINLSIDHKTMMWNGFRKEMKKKKKRVENQNKLTSTSTTHFYFI